MECSICFEPYGLLTKVPCITTCSHTYCNDCCKTMFEAESKVRCICPLCRSDVKSFRFDPIILEKVYKEIKEAEMRKEIMGTCLQCEKGLEVRNDAFICLTCNLTEIEEDNSCFNLVFCKDCVFKKHRNCFVEHSLEYLSDREDLLFGKINCGVIPTSMHWQWGLVLSILLKKCFKNKSSIDQNCLVIILTLWERMKKQIDDSKLRYFFFFYFQQLLVYVSERIEQDKIESFVHFIAFIATNFAEQSDDISVLRKVYCFLFKDILEKIFIQVQLADNNMFSTLRMSLIKTIIEIYELFHNNFYAVCCLLISLTNEMNLLRFYKAEFPKTPEVVEYESILKRVMSVYCRGLDYGQSVDKREQEILCDIVFENA